MRVYRGALDTPDLTFNRDLIKFGKRSLVADATHGTYTHEISDLCPPKGVYIYRKFFLKNSSSDSGRSIYTRAYMYIYRTNSITIRAGIIVTAVGKSIIT